MIDNKTENVLVSFCMKLWVFTVYFIKDRFFLYVFTICLQIGHLSFFDVNFLQQSSQEFACPQGRKAKTPFFVLNKSHNQLM